MLGVDGWLREVGDWVVFFGAMAAALGAIGALYVGVRRTRFGKAVGRAWARAVTGPRDERRAHAIRALILPDLDAVRADTREIAGELKREVRGVIDSHTLEEMAGVRAQTEAIREVRDQAGAAVALATQAVELGRVNAARIEDVARTVGAARTTPIPKD